MFYTLYECTYNVTSRRVRVTIVAVEKHQLLHTFELCFRSLRCSTCNARALCFHLWPVLPYSIIPHYLIKVTILERKIC